MIVALPDCLQVDVTRSANGRDYFTVLEGVERGSQFSVKAGNLSKDNPGYRGPAMLTFSRERELLTYPGGQVKAITYEGKPIPIGQHPIQIPDFPHIMGEGYLSKTPYALTWFFLGHGNAIPGNSGTDRYLHTGTISAGCITVEPSGWTALYQYLIRCRRGDAKTVGTVTVVR